MKNHNNLNSPEHLRQEYISRINCVLDYIEMNLHEQLSLEKVAEVAHFSPYHFHRIFSAMMGEPLNRFIQRLRVEKAATSLRAYPSQSVTQIALSCGFGSSASFARAFKEYYKISASEWRRQKINNPGKTNSKDGKHHGISGEVNIYSSIYFSSAPNKQLWRIEMKDKKQNLLKAEVEVKNLPEQTVAYVRHVGAYAGDASLFAKYITKLFKWAGPRGLLNFPVTQQLNIYHDDPNLTDESKLRLSIGITVPPNTETSGEIGKMKVPAGKYAIARFELKEDQFEEAWDAVYGGWLPQSGYQPGDGFCFEICHNNPEEHPEHKHAVDICIPVKPL